jgi:hypothetical protein
MVIEYTQCFIGGRWRSYSLVFCLRGTVLASHVRLGLYSTLKKNYYYFSFTQTSLLNKIIKKRNQTLDPLHPDCGSPPAAPIVAGEVGRPSVCLALARHRCGDLARPELSPPLRHHRRLGHGRHR